MKTKSSLAAANLRGQTASMMEMIQKRTMTRGSGHPSFSKWWWMGAIKKMRFLKSL